MIIKSVTIEGMHNVSKKTYNFNNLNYLHGPNGSGKSTVLEAIQLALLGYIPGTAKRKEAIMGHSNSRTLTVTLRLDDDGQLVTIERMWANIKSSIASDVTITPENYDIESIVRSIECPIFNFSEFINMTANNLKDWFINFLPKQDIAIDWRAELTKDLNSHNIDVSDKFIQDTVADISEFPETGVDLIRKVNEHFKSVLSSKKKDLDRSLATIQSLIYYEDVDESLSETEIIDAIRKYEQAKQAEEASIRVIQRNAEIRMKLKSFEKYSADSVESDTEYTNSLSEIEYWTNRIADTVSEKASLQSDIQECRSTITELTSKKAEILAAINVKKSVVDGGGICPYTNTSCQSIEPLVNQYTSDIAAMQKDVDAIISQISELQSTIREKEHAISDMEYTNTQASSMIRSLESYKSQMETAYKMKAQYEAELVEEPKLSGVDYDHEISALRDVQSKIVANNMYNQLIDKLTSDKFALEQEIAAYKSWIILTGVNGLQNTFGADTVFNTLAEGIDAYIQPIFGSNTCAAFHLDNKANSFSFGIKRDETYVPYNLLSSGEKCMYALALLLNIASMNDGLKLVMIDDLFDHLDDHNITALFTNLNQISTVQMIFAGVKSVEGDYVIEVES